MSWLKHCEKNILFTILRKSLNALSTKYNENVFKCFNVLIKFGIYVNLSTQVAKRG
jgi:hypothetical protein